MLAMQWIAILGGLLVMMGQQDRSEALFYYFRLEDQVPENHLLGGSAPRQWLPPCTCRNSCCTFNCESFSFIFTDSSYGTSVSAVP
jgi:hypothetical protein